MNLLEFSYEFEILYNNIMSNGAPGVSEYEKSVFLTEAQELLVQGYYTGNMPTDVSFEKTEECRRYLDELVKDVTLTTKVDRKGISSMSVFYDLPKELWFITYELVELKDDNMPCSSSRTALVIPVTQDDCYKALKNPFRQPNENRVFRLDVSTKTSELISKYNIDSYFVRYLEKPEPIILEDLSNGLSIDGMSTANECKLNSALHRLIVMRAVQLATAVTVPPSIQNTLQRSL